MLLTILLIALGLIGFAVYLVYKYAGADGLSRFKTNLWHEVQTILVISISLYVFSSAYVYILKNHMFHNYYECEPINLSMHSEKSKKDNVKATFHVYDEVMRVYRSDSIGYDEYTLEKEDIKWQNLVITGERLYSRVLTTNEALTKYGRPEKTEYMNIFYQPNLFWFSGFLMHERGIWITPHKNSRLTATPFQMCDWKMRIFPRQVSTP